MSGGSKKSVPSIPTETSHLDDPIFVYKAHSGVYPSNSEVWWGYRRPVEVGSDSSPKNYLEVFDPALRHQITSGNGQVSRGHYRYNAFRMDRSATSGVSGLPIQTSGSYRPAAVAFYAGRVFYAGVNVSEYNTKVYFSQILERPEQVQSCHQSLDPTSEDLRDLLASDGGVIVIPEVTEVYFMFAMGLALFVFARNGVWQISGSQGFGFRANDYSVSKISGTPALSPLSLVSVEGAPIWWNKSNIYTIEIDQVGMGHVKNLTQETIKTFLDTIPEESKKYVKGAYDPLTQKVQWLYRSTAPTTDAERFQYNRILVLDTRTGAWYPYSPSDDPRVYIKGIFNIEGTAVIQTLEDVYVDTDQVFVDSDAVYSIVETRKAVQSKTKYIVDVLPDTVGLPETPAVPEPEEVFVYVDEDQVFVDADAVYVIGI